MAVSSVSTFEQSAEALRLSPSGKAQAWETLLQTRIGPDDPEAVRVILHIALLEDAARVADGAKSILNEARATIGDAAKETAERLAETAAKVERASLKKIEARQAELAGKLGAEIGKAANDALGRKVRVLGQNTLAAWMLTASLLAAGMGTGGYLLGKRNAEANGEAVTSMLAREDGSAWRTLMEANNGAAALATYCQAGSPHVRRVDGGTICSVPLWLRRDGVVGPVAGRPAEGEAVLASVSGWLASWGPWWLLGAGFLSFMLLRKLARVLWAWPPVAWLFDLPIKRIADEEGK